MPLFSQCDVKYDLQSYIIIIICLKYESPEDSFVFRIPHYESRISNEPSGLSYLYTSVWKICVTEMSLLILDFRIDPSEYSKLAKLIDESKADIVITFHSTLRILVQNGLTCDHLRWFQSCSAGKL